MKPLIGLTPLWDDAAQNSWMLPAYTKIIEATGGACVMLSESTDPDVLLSYILNTDGLLFTGGQDINPAIYGMAPSAQCGSLCAVRDAMEVALFKKARDIGKPIFGICRGLQFINAVMGGTLYQDLASEHPTGTLHRQEKPYDKPAHTVNVLPATTLAGIVGEGALPVNSLHHQAIRDLAPGFVAEAVSEDGLIEAIDYKADAQFISAVQWHPELSFESDTASLAILRHFIDACRR